MNSAMWLQYLIVAALVVTSAAYTLRKLAAGAKRGDCAGSCGGCGGCDSPKSIESGQPAPITFHRRSGK